MKFGAILAEKDYNLDKGKKRRDTKFRFQPYLNLEKMKRRGLGRGSSSSKHRPTEEFKLPENYLPPPSLLDFPIHDSRKTDIVEIGGLEITDPTLLPKSITENRILKRREDESWEEFGSRLAVDELDRFVKFEYPKSSIAVEKLKEKQSEEIERRKSVLNKEDIVHPMDNDEIEYPQSTTPPGPPNRLEPNMVMTQGKGARRKDSFQDSYEALPRKTTGTLFNDLESIPTDPTIDPPPRACYNCWRKGHNRSKCPKPITESHCENCGRKFETIATCPRCAKGYRKFLLNQAKGKSYKKESSLIRDEGEEVERRPMRLQRLGNQLLPSMWKTEVNLGINKDGHGSSERAWYIPKTPSPQMARHPILFASENKFKEEEATEVLEGSKDLDSTQGGDEKSEVSRGDECELPPPYESTRGQITPLVRAIQDLTMAMRGLPNETINLAVQQLIKERQLELEGKLSTK